MMLRSLSVILICMAVSGCDQRSEPASKSKMQNPVNYFEIPVNDLDRALQFYESVFECKLERKSIDGNQMAIFDGNPNWPGSFGALAYGPSYKPSSDGTRIYFFTHSIDAVLARVLARGGRVEYPKTAVLEIGFVAEFIDSEGNRIALHEPQNSQ